MFCSDGSTPFQPRPLPTFPTAAQVAKTKKDDDWLPQNRAKDNLVFEAGMLAIIYAWPNLIVPWAKVATLLFSRKQGDLAFQTLILNYKEKIPRILHCSSCRVRHSRSVNEDFYVSLKSLSSVVLEYYCSTNFCTMRPECYKSFFYRRARILEQNFWKMVWILVSSLLYFYCHELIIASFHILHPIHTPTNKQVTAWHFFGIFVASTNNRNPATFKMFHWFSQFLSQSRNKELHTLFLFLSPTVQLLFLYSLLALSTPFCTA